MPPAMYCKCDAGLQPDVAREMLHKWFNSDKKRYMFCRTYSIIRCRSCCPPQPSAVPYCIPASHSTLPWASAKNSICFTATTKTALRSEDDPMPEEKVNGQMMKATRQSRWCRMGSDGATYRTPGCCRIASVAKKGMLPHSHSAVW